MPLTEYLKTLSQELAQGNATEHTHRPALKTLIESLASGLTATNEPKRVACGAPDYIVTKGECPLGYIEAKEVGAALDSAEKSNQLERYRESLGNLIRTDYLEFRWYVRPDRTKANDFPRAEHRLTAKLASVGKNGKLRVEKDGEKEVLELLNAFLSASVPTVQSAKELALRMAALARLMRDTIRKALSDEPETGSLHQQMEGFREVLIHDLTEDQFADMYAQTICYGLFAARCNKKGSEHFTRQNAAYGLPKTNPFLRKMFNHIAGPELDERIAWAVDDLAELLHRSDISAILQDFGRSTRREDPVVHFYETFLAAYDPKMREARGVYYTPEPVVSYIVRSIDHILKTDFKLADGLANSSKITIKSPDGNGKTEVHKVLILDPATGTGTFLYGVINQIFESFKKNLGMWSGYVSEHLLPRMFGFELLMAPYAVAHMKLGLLLDETGYGFQTDERLRVYLTNTLEEAQEVSKLPLFTQWLAEEANEASRIKQEAPVMVVLGNPPYSGHSANVSPWINDLLRGRDSHTGKTTGNYFEVDGQPLGERNPKWLNDDYVKFIRFAQWRIEQTGYGILAFISNNGYLDNPTFRGMRQSLMKTFDEIYLLDLHGNTKKKERAPDGSKDENVFDIRQGVAIGIFVKRSGGRKRAASVHHAHLWGVREIYEEDTQGDRVLSGGKYYWLWNNDVGTTKWKELKGQSPFYLFVPQDSNLRSEWERGWKVTDIFAVNSLGIATARDFFSIAFTRAEIWDRVSDFVNLPPEQAREKYELGEDVRDWKVDLAQNDLKASGPSPEYLQPILYRPFDERYTYFTGISRGFHCMPRREVMGHMLAGENVGLSTTRSIEIGRGWEHVFCSSQLIQLHTVSLKEVNYLFPLYLYDAATKTDLFESNGPGTQTGRRANLAPEFVAALTSNLKMNFIHDGKGDSANTFGPEDVFDYMYAVFHSPTYRARYAEFLKIDFPRLPLTSNADLFRELCALGSELVALHLMEKHAPPTTTYPVAGANGIDKVRYTGPAEGGSEQGRVWINREQYFEGVPPEVWNFHIGGYQVCQKWLKDHKGRKLTYNDLTHYQHIVSALSETIHLMSEIDAAIEDHGGWPMAL